MNTPSLSVTTTSTLPLAISPSESQPVIAPLAHLAEEIVKSYVRLGNRRKAIQYLQKSYNNREGTLVYLKVEPLYKPLHGDIRFKNLVQSMGLPPN